MPAPHPLQHVPSTAEPLSAERRRFNKHLERIDKLRARLQAWETAERRYAQGHLEQVVPLESTLRAEKKRWVHMLDDLLAQRGWKRAERETMTEVLLDTVGELLGREPDAELVALYDRHAEVDFATEEAEQLQAMHAMAREATGLDLGDEPVTSQEDLMARMARAMAARQGDDGDAPAPPTGTARRRKPRSKTAVQQQREDETAQALQSVREVYRKLASALHPDRETDEAERARKTALMQRANDAQARNDLLALLELQLEVELVGPEATASLSDDRLRSYNRVLAEQVRSLEREVDLRAMRFCETYGLMTMSRRPQPKELPALLLQVRHHMTMAVEALNHTMTLSLDKAAFRRWLKRQEQRMREDDLFDRSF